MHFLFALVAEGPRFALRRCMGQDCQQSIDSMSAQAGKGNFCRFLDGLGLCYTYREAQVLTHCRHNGFPAAPSPQPHLRSPVANPDCE